MTPGPKRCGDPLHQDAGRDRVVQSEPAERACTHDANSRAELPGQADGGFGRDPRIQQAPDKRCGGIGELAQNLCAVGRGQDDHAPPDVAAGDLDRRVVEVEAGRPVAVPLSGKEAVVLACQASCPRQAGRHVEPRTARVQERGDRGARSELVDDDADGIAPGACLGRHERHLNLHRP